jgi:hypothetical protein
MRFNSDSQKLEYWDGSQWVQVHTFSPNLNGGARGVFVGGTATPTFSNVIDYITISSTGNAVDFGDMTTARGGLNSGSCSSSTRGIRVGGDPVTNEIRFVTISSTGDEQTFGTLDTAKRQTSSVSNQTRGVFGGGTPVAKNQLEYITISSTGNSVDFGNLTINRDGAGGMSSPTRGLFACGINDTPTSTNQTSIDFITTATLGNAQDFGDMTAARHVVAGISNAIRGLCGGGLNPGSLDVIDYITIASLGNGVDFGNLSEVKRSVNGCASPTRGIFAGGDSGGTRKIEIEYVNILTQGNSVDFGDLTVARMEHTSFSNAHGGL